MSFASSYHVFYWLQLPKKKKRAPPPDIFPYKIHVKCLSFRDMGINGTGEAQIRETGCTDWPRAGQTPAQPLRPKNRPAATGADHSVTLRPVLEVSAQS